MLRSNPRLPDWWYIKQGIKKSRVTVPLILQSIEPTADSLQKN